MLVQSYLRFSSFTTQLTVMFKHVCKVYTLHMALNVESLLVYLATESALVILDTLLVDNLDVIVKTVASIYFS